jgi:hypothetical protein
MRRREKTHYPFTTLIRGRKRFDLNRAIKSVPGDHVILCSKPQLQFFFKYMSISIPKLFAVSTATSLTIEITQLSERFNWWQCRVIYKHREGPKEYIERTASGVDSIYCIVRVAPIYRTVCSVKLTQFLLALFKVIVFGAPVLKSSI